MSQCLEGQGKWPCIQYQSRGSPRCIFGANLVVLAQIHYKLLHGQAKFLKIVRMTLRSRSMTPIFNTSREYPRMHVRCTFGDSSPNLWLTSFRKDKPNFLEFYVKMAKMIFKFKVNNPYFQYQLRVSQDACFFANLVIPAQICDKLSCGQDHCCMDGRMNAGDDNTPSAWKAKGQTVWINYKNSTEYKQSCSTLSRLHFA